MNKLANDAILNGTLFGLKKEGNPDMNYNMDEP